MTVRAFLCSILSLTLTMGLAHSDQASRDRSKAIANLIEEKGYDASLDLTLIETVPFLNRSVGSCATEHNRKSDIINCVNTAYATYEICGPAETETALIICWGGNAHSINQKIREIEFEQDKIKQQQERERTLKHETILDSHAKLNADWLAAEESHSDSELSPTGEVSTEKQIDNEN